MPTFFDDTDRMDFLDRVGGLVGRGDVIVHAFCLMPNHYHLLCETPHGRLAKMIRHINGDYARSFNSRHRRVGHLWQGRYKAILVQDGPYLLECSRYIHLNPNRSRLTRPAERYRWSSYRNYIGAAPACVPWIVTEKIVAAFDGDRRRYREWVESGKGEKSINPFERAVAGLVLGSEALVARVRGILEGRPTGLDEPSAKRLCTAASKPAPEVIEAQVREIFGNETPRRRRTLRYYALRRYSSLGVSGIAHRCQCSSTAVSMAVKRLDDEAKHTEALAAGLNRLAISLSTPSK